MADDRARTDAFCEELTLLCEKHRLVLIGEAHVGQLNDDQGVRCHSISYERIFFERIDNPKTGVIMTEDEIFAKLVEMRYAVSSHRQGTDETVRYGTMVMLGQCGEVDGIQQFKIYAQHNDKRQRETIRMKLMEAFGDVDNIKIDPKGMGNITAR